MRAWLLAVVCACLFVGSSRAASLETYAAAPDISRIALSVSGTHFALIAQEGAQTKLYVRKTSGEPVLIAPLNDMKVRDLIWVGDEHLLIIASATVAYPGNGVPPQEWSAAIHVDLRSRKSTTVFGEARELIRAVFGYYGEAKIDGVWHAYFGATPYRKVTARTRSQIPPDLYRVNLDTGDYQEIAKSDENSRSWLIDAEGRLVGHTILNPVRQTWSLFVPDQAAEPIFSGDLKEYDGFGATLGRMPGSVAVGEGSAAGDLIREFAPGGPKDGERLTAGEPVRGRWVDPGTRRLIGFNYLGKPRTRFLDEALQRRFVAATKAFPDMNVELVSISRGLNQMVVLVDGPKDAGAYWLVDIAGKSATAIGEARKAIPPAEVGPMRMFSFKAADGLAMDGVLTLPSNREAKDLPVVVLVNDGLAPPPAEPRFDWRAQAFASRGYAVFQPNIRGTLGYGEAFREAARDEMGGKMQSDISDGLAALAVAGIVDAKRACIVGSGYGGYRALAGVSLQTGMYRCAISVGGVSDLGVMLNVLGSGTSGRIRTKLFKRLIPGEDSASLAAISPADQANRTDAPVLLIHGEDDTQFPKEQSEIMERALKRAGKPVELVILEDADHQLNQPAARASVLTKAVAFVEQHNPPN